MIVTVDTGGTKTLVTSFDSEGKPGKELRFATPKDCHEYATQLLATLQTNYDASDISAIAVAIPGQITDGVIDWCGNLPWKNYALGKQLASHYTCPILIENDANLAGLSEANILDPVPPLCVYVTVSTGIGTGIIVGGKLLPELRKSEAGHMMLRGETGALATWQETASGRAVYRAYGKKAYEITDDATWQVIAEHIASGLLALIPTLQPDVIVVGGSLGTHYEKYDHFLKAALREALPDVIALPKIVQARHPQEAVIYGCYYYAVAALAA